ncbi:MAG: type IV toxin-antitoxin system AbiEi family antitoxin domain-containing protein [Candidatus Micrarchaeia archaeon]
MKYMLPFVKKFSSDEYPVFTSNDATKFLTELGATDTYAKFLIKYLLRKGRIVRITKGVYSFSHDAELYGFGFQPFYYGLQHALTLNDLWPEQTSPVVITTRNVRSGVRNVGGTRIFIKHIDSKYFFGFYSRIYNNRYLPVSDPEKTLIDFVYFRRTLSEQTYAEIVRRIDIKKLRGYLKNYKPKTAKTVMKIVKKYT